MGRPDYDECQVCGADSADVDINTRGKCAICNKAGRSAAACIGGRAGTGKSKQRSFARTAIRKSARVRQPGKENVRLRGYRRLLFSANDESRFNS